MNSQNFRADPGIVMEHWTARLTEAPEWAAYKTAIQAEIDRITRTLTSTTTDTASEAVLHALRGEIRGLRTALALPGRRAPSQETG